MKKGLLFLLLSSAILQVSAQDITIETKQEKQQNAIDQLQWLIGKWSGQSEVDVEGIHHTTFITETITPALDGTILTISARGTEADSLTKKMTVVYTSYSVISYDEKSKKYRWSTWRNPGNSYDSYDFKVGSNSYEYIADERGGKMRYTAQLNDKKEWTSTGDYSKDGLSWGKFITMILRKR